MDKTLDRTLVTDTNKTTQMKTPQPSPRLKKETEKVTKIQITKDEYFDICYHQLSNLLDSKISLRNIVKRITQCMKIVENFKKLNGVEKKDLVIDVMQKLIRDSDNDETVETILIDTLEAVGHPMIDTIIAASKGKFFSNLKMKCYKCFTCSK